MPQLRPMNNKLHFDEKPASDILPQGTVPLKLKFENIVSDTTDYWKYVDTKYYQQYNKGTIMAGSAVSTTPEYEKVVEVLIDTVFQSIRDNVNENYTESDLEEKQEALKKISAVEKVFESGIMCLKELNIKLDIISVLTILQGSINESVHKTTRQYEATQRTKH